ncbi:MAG: Stk1 family PASTA domain-containing Ser/Thr kinase [Slackia sp.]|nr:Stk1 family PASTA domain-containing Ser/Thr kinase [Slackia sp.]
MIGRVFNGRYKITERIGIGGMAEVYKAQDQVLGRTVAVKVMLPQYAADSEFTARFKQEAASAANLQSPYIVNVYDWGQDGGTYFIVMEYVRGTDLKSAIQQRGAINQRKVAEIGSQVCQALSVAHGQDIMHRDIKPQNIMVQPDGNVKVMDFGIARAKNSVKAKTSSVLGTAHYISPEQAQGKELDGASDIYSLGCVLYEAATGQLPFDGPDAVSVAMRQVNEAPLPPSQVKPDISPDLEAIIMKAMEKNPYNRFQTVRDMKHALDDFLMGRPVTGVAGNIASAPTAVMGNVPPIGPMAMGAEGGTAVMPAVNPANSGSMKAASFRMDDDSKKKSNKKTIGIVVGLIAGIIAIAAIAMALIGGGETKVPDVLGQTQESAVKAIEAAGYVVGDITEEYNNDTVAGRVCKQDPNGGTALEKGEKVNLVISKGVENGSVPDLKTMTAEQAEKALKDAGYTPQYAGNEASDADKDTVCKQSPEAGTQADKGTTVKYWISTGPEDIEVPNVVGSDQASAKSTLEKAGFTVNVVTGDYSDKYAEGQVMAQNPNGGKLAKGETVTITISKGEDPANKAIDIPNVVGMNSSDAQSAIANLDLRYNVIEASSDQPKGTVIKQSPASGQAKKGDTITITVSTGPSSNQGNNGSGNGQGSNQGEEDEAEN